MALQQQLFKNINYKKITVNETDKFTPELLKDISAIDQLFYKKPNEIINYINLRKKENINTIFYLVYDGKELLGTTIGHVKNTSELYKPITKNENYFHLTEMFVNPKYQNKGVGSLLMSRVLADQRVNHKSKFVLMYSFPATVSVVKKITGNKPFILPTSNSAKTKEIIRNFKNSKFKYNLKTFTESPEYSGYSKKQIIYINKKKKNIIKKPR